MSIFSLAALSMFMVFHTGMLSYKKMDASTRVLRMARLVLARLQNDLKNCVSYTGKDSFFHGESGSLEFFAVIDSYRSGKAMTGLSRLSYSFKDGTLTRVCSTGKDAVLAVAVAPEQLCDGIAEYSFSFAMRPETPGKPYEWSQQWPPAQGKDKSTGLPLAIKVSLVLMQADGQPAGFIKLIPLEAS